MVARSLVKLIDEAIIPAMLLVFAKIAGILITNYIFHIEFTVQTQGFLGILPTISYPSAANYITVENYSNLLMFLMASIGALTVIIRAHLLHESHISPKFHQKLVTFKLEKLVSSSFHLYHQALIWMTFLWLIILFLVLSTISNVTYLQITTFAVIIAANFTWILALDVQKETEI